MKYLIIVYMNFLPIMSYARDFRSALKSSHSELMDILMLVAPIALLIVGGTFFVCIQKGADRLMAFVIGVAIAFSSASIVMFLQGIFR